MGPCLHAQVGAQSMPCHRPEQAHLRHRLQAGTCLLHRQKCRHSTVCTAATGKFAGKQQQMLVRRITSVHTQELLLHLRDTCMLLPVPC